MRERPTQWRGGAPGPPPTSAILIGTVRPLQGGRSPVSPAATSCSGRWKTRKAIAANNSQHAGKQAPLQWVGGGGSQWCKRSRAWGPGPSKSGATDRSAIPGPGRVRSSYVGSSVSSRKQVQVDVPVVRIGRSRATRCPRRQHPPEANLSPGQGRTSPPQSSLGSVVQ